MSTHANESEFSFNVEGILQEAFSSAQSYNIDGSFINESNLKHELFHQIASMRHKGTFFSDKYPDCKTCIIHSEAKIQNGTELSQKADLILCTPSEAMNRNGKSFNYKINTVFELKDKFNSQKIKTEIEKFFKYNNTYENYYLVEPYRKLKLNKIELDKIYSASLKYFAPDAPAKYKIEYYDYEYAKQLIHESIIETLYLYGHNNYQFQGFFWCNYEHELNRRVSFPCEGDFNAQLYHNIKTKLPFCHLETEYVVNKKRIDIVAIGKNNAWCIPIEVKLNWDQFKKKYKDGKQKDEEIKTIYDRFLDLKKLGFQAIDPYLIVIQGDNYYSSFYSNVEEGNNKHRSLSIAKKMQLNVNMLSFNESTNKVGAPTTK